LITAVLPLENISDGEKDWHPRTDNQVLNLVHPSLYPIVYDCTLSKDPQTGERKALQPPGLDKYSISQEFQWLPSDFRIAEDGTVTLASPYINNIHPQKHAALESVIPKLLGRAVSLWEHVLSDMRRSLLPFRTKSKVRDSPPACIFADGWETDEDLDAELDAEHDAEHDADRDVRLSKRDLKLPVARKKYTGDLNEMKTPAVSLKGTTIQCIIKLANIVLTPEKPEYPGDKWHIEG
jgi:hypothetical protein